jgi:DNA-binding transcriptional MerR regulator
MSRRTLLIVVSLTANVVLGVVWWQRDAESRSLALSDAKAAESARAAADQAKVAPVADWTTLTAEATEEDFVARLKREGFPLRVIRELLRLRLREKYADRLRALEQRQPVVPYWRQRAAPQEIDLEARAKLRALNQEISNEIKQLLGPDVFQLPGDYAYENRERTYGPIPSDKIAGIESINADYSEMANQIREEARGVIFPEDREKLVFLERERRADLARALTSEEFAHYERRNSSTALGLRSQLRWFGPNEEEYVAVFEAQRAFDEKYGFQHLSGEQADRRRDSRPELFAAIEAALGSQRFEDYRLMTDGNYGGTVNMVQSIGLPPERAKDLVRIQQDAGHRAEALRREAGLAVDERLSRLESLRDEARSKVTTILGADHVGAYEQNAGNWLGQIVPPKR